MCQYHRRSDNVSTGWKLTLALLPKAATFAAGKLTGPRLGPATFETGMALRAWQTSRAG